MQPDGVAAKPDAAPVTDRLGDNVRAFPNCLIGTAGWSIPKAAQNAFLQGSSHLTRYAVVLSAAEINSSFHRPHRRAVYEKWAASVPPGFRFSVKLPKEISHTRKLVDCGEPLASFIEQIARLGEKLGVVLLQLPPSLAFAPDTASSFLTNLRDNTASGAATTDALALRSLLATTI